MQREIQLEGKHIPYTLRVSDRALRMRFTVYGDGSCVLTAPRHASTRVIDEFVQRKARWVIRALARFVRLPRIRPMSKAYRRRLYVRHKEAARALAHERLAHFNQLYGFTFCRVSIKDQRSCWGSCSKKGNLNFNYKIALLPARLADYIIIHELCHLGEPNHSKSFWNLVTRSMPDYAIRKQELKRHAVLA